MRPTGSTTSAVRLRSQRMGEPMLCAVHGEIDISNVAELEDGLAEGFRRGPSVVADLSEVHFFASAGVRALVDAIETQPRSHVLGVVTGPGVDTILRICGLAAATVCRPDLDSANRACMAELRARRT